MATVLKVRDIERAVSRIVSKEEVAELARSTGMLKRSRKIVPWVLLWTLVLGLGGEKRRSMASLRRLYEKLSGSDLAPSSFQERFSAALVMFLKKLTELALSRQSCPTRELKGMWSSFSDVVLADSTVITLHAKLRDVFRGTGRMGGTSALKLHMVMSVTGRGPRTVRLSSETQKDGRCLSVGPWVKERLLMFDLGYYSFRLFDRISRNGGYFISRVRGGSNPLIISALTPVSGQPIDVAGKKLKDVLPNLQRRTLDFEVEVKFKRRSYRGKRRQATTRLRLVGVFNDETQAYHLYFTNVPPKTLSAEQVANSYRGRWLIELAFREMKGSYRLGDYTCANRYFVEASIYSVILTLVVSRALWWEVRRRSLGARLYATPERWAKLFESLAPQLAERLVAPFVPGEPLTRTLNMLLSEAPDVHLKRKGGLLRRLEYEDAL